MTVANITTVALGKASGVASQHKGSKPTGVNLQSKMVLGMVHPSIPSAPISGILLGSITPWAERPSAAQVHRLALFHSTGTQSSGTWKQLCDVSQTR